MVHLKFIEKVTFGVLITILIINGYFLIKVGFSEAVNGSLVLSKTTADASVVSSEESFTQKIDTDVSSTQTEIVEVHQAAPEIPIKAPSTTPVSKVESDSASVAKSVTQKEPVTEAKASPTPTLPQTSQPKVAAKPIVTAPSTPIKAAPIVKETPVVITSSKSPSFSSAAMLKEHNVVRDEAGVPPLTWSTTLAASAQKWSETLKGESCKMRHTPNPQYGENIYQAWTTAIPEEGLVSSPKKAVTAWAAEEAFYNYAKNTCLPGEMCGHYTQLVWANTTEVGCGVSVCMGEDRQTDIWVCQYNPYGNITGLKPF